MKVLRKLIIYTKYHVNQIDCVESSRGGPIDPPPQRFVEAPRLKSLFQLKVLSNMFSVSCNYEGKSGSNNI